MTGSVYFDANFKCKDGSINSKFFVIVYQDDNIALAVKTTSQDRRYQSAKPHCNTNPIIYFIPSGMAATCFPKQTYIQIDDIYEFSNLSLLQKSLERAINHKCDLPENIVNGIRNCIKRNRDDIELKYHRYF